MRFALLLFLASCTSQPTSVADASVPDDALADAMPMPEHDHDVDVTCRGGCAVEAPMDEDILTAGEYRDLLAQVAQEPVGTASLALETLLYHHDDTGVYLDEIGAPGLPDEHEAFLRTELSRTHATVEMRLVDADGNIKASLEPSIIPIGIKQHLTLQTDGLKTLITGGTVRRVGLHHLWSRW